MMVTQSGTRRAELNGVVLTYEDSGSGEPVVFIHGALIADAFGLLLAQPPLAGRYRLIRYRRRGYTGSSPVAGPVSVPRQADDCRLLLRHLGVTRAHVVGHSYGGAIALQLALDAPEAVRSLALLEPALLVGESAESYRQAMASNEERYASGDAATVVDEFLAARFGPGYRSFLDAAVPGAFDQAVASSATTFGVEMPALRAWRFGPAEARQIIQPALVVLGERSDALWPRFGETHRALLEWLPRAEPFVLPGASHALQMDNPRDMAHALADFLCQHPLAS